MNHQCTTTTTTTTTYTTRNENIIVYDDDNQDYYLNDKNRVHANIIEKSFTTPNVVSLLKSSKCKEDLENKKEFVQLNRNNTIEKKVSL